MSSAVVYSWVLKIELNGEWEECTFQTRSEALMAFIALAADYELNLRRAVLFAPERVKKLLSLGKEKTICKKPN